MKAQCKNCGTWFKISPELNELIEEGIIHPLEVNLCAECAEIEADKAEYLEYMYNVIEEL